MVAERAGGGRALAPGGLLDLEVALRADGGAAALQHVDVGVVEEADGAFLVGVADAGLGSFEAGGEAAVAYDTAYVALFPFAAFVQPRRFAACVQFSFAQS